jgi:enamine deaminase RidA (YjgF/YER057c/UK114 family)
LQKTNGEKMSEIQHIDSGARLSEATVFNNVIYAAGMVAGESLGKSVREQTIDILAQIDKLLARLGSDKTKILKANIWLTDISKITEMNEVWDSWVVAGKTPARATVEAKLAKPGYAVEIMVEAAV